MRMGPHPHSHSNPPRHFVSAWGPSWGWGLRTLIRTQIPHATSFRRGAPRGDGAFAPSFALKSPTPLRFGVGPLAGMGPSHPHSHSNPPRQSVSAWGPVWDPHVTLCRCGGRAANDASAY